MKTMVSFLAVVIAAAAFLAISQREEINAARSKLEQLEGSRGVHSVEVVPAGAVPAVSKPTAEDVARLREKNRDIHSLRGQIHLAREKRRAFEKMQAENAEMREKIARIKADPDTALANTFAFSNKGQATPEAAIETMFWAMYQGDIESLSRLMPKMTLEYERMPPEERSRNITLLRALASTVGSFDVLERKLPSPDEAHLEVRIKPRDGASQVEFFDKHQNTFVLRRTNEVWQILDF